MKFHYLDDIDDIEIQEIREQIEMRQGRFEEID
jgi:hypothetical protein